MQVHWSIFQQVLVLNQPQLSILRHLRGAAVPVNLCQSNFLTDATQLPGTAYLLIAFLGQNPLLAVLMVQATSRHKDICA